MKLLRPSELKFRPDHVVFRQSRMVGTFRMVAMGIVFGAGGPVLGLVGFPWWVWVPCWAVALLFPVLIFPRSIGALYRNSNWVLATDRNAIWINLRSHLNYHLPEGLTVLQLERSEIDINNTGVAMAKFHGF